MLLTGTGRTDSYLQFLTVLILFVFVLGITWVTTRWIANYQKGRALSGNLEVVETLRITGNKFLQIVRAGKKYLVIAVGKDEIHMLTELTEDEVTTLKEHNTQNPDFKSILEKLKKQNAIEDDLKLGSTKKKFALKRISKIICLLIMAGILCIMPGMNASATEVDSNLTGTTDERTNITEPGSAQDADDLAELNIANTVTVTYDNGNGQINGTLRILITLTLIALAPTLLIMLTSFTRIIIVLHFTRAALNTQTAPPNQVLIGLALFLTFFVMRPYMTQIYEEAIVPMEQGEIDQQEFFERGVQPLREFMYKQTQKEDVMVFMDIAGEEWESGALDDIPLTVLIPSFMVGELRQAFIIGFLIYIPFIVIDMVVASALMSMGMMMLPPTTISMPFKILLFVLADGWNLIIVELIRTFH